MFEWLKSTGARLKNKGLALVSVVKGKVKELQDQIQEQVVRPKQESDMLDKWIDKFKTAKTAMSDAFTLMDEREAIYYGTRDTDRNPNLPANSENAPKLAANVQNVTYEMIETCVDNTYPLAIVEQKRAESEFLARMIEDVIRGDLADVNMANYNDVQERTCPIQGYSIFEPYWDDTIKRHTYRGDVNVRLIHPKQFVPQPRVWDVQRMDYYFIMASVTKQYIKMRYDVDVSKEEEEYPDINALAKDGFNLADSPNVTEITCWYKDDDGDVGRVVWCNSTLLENLPKFYYRRDSVGNIITDGDPLTSEYTTTSGTVIAAGEKIPYYVPNKYPIVIRRNVPVTFAFGGQSDVDVIRDQQEAIKKTMTKLQEKILSGGSIIGMAESMKGHFSVSDKTLQIAWFQTPEQKQLFGVENLQPDVSKDMAFLSQQYNVVQSTLGVTDVFQGKYDPSARSGLAKQIAIEQSMGRLRSKQLNKNQAYKELFEIWFMLKLAYCDEPRPYTRKDIDGQIIYEEFNRLEFLMRDAAEALFYETEFIFSADASGGIPKDRSFLMEKAVQQFQVGAYGNPADPQTLVRYWQTLEKLHFPGAAEIRTQMVDMAANKTAVPGTEPQPEESPGAPPAPPGMLPEMMMGGGGLPNG